MRSYGIYLSRQADSLPWSHLGSPLPNFTEHLLCDRHSKWLTTNSGTNFYGTHYVPSVLFNINLIIKTTLQGWVLLLSPFYKREKWDTERLRDLPKVSQLPSDNERNWTWTHTYNYSTILPPKPSLYYACHFRGSTKQGMSCSYFCGILPLFINARKAVCLQCDSKQIKFQGLR